jgi:WD40 repeat protein
MMGLLYGKMSLLLRQTNPLYKKVSRVQIIKFYNDFAFPLGKPHFTLMSTSSSPELLRKTRRLTGTLALLALVMGMIGAYNFMAYREAQQQIFHAEEAKHKAQHKAALADQAAQHAAQQVQLALQEKNYALHTQSLYLSSLSAQETAKGNATDGALLALEALPKNIANPDRPFLMQAEVNLRQALDKLYEKQLFRGHKEEIWQLVLSPDGKILASASADHTVRLWEMSTGKMLQTLQHNDQVWEIAFNSTGSQLVSASLDRNARLWSVETGELLATLPHQKEVYSVVFIENLIVSADASGTIKIWEHGQAKMVLNAHRSAIHKLTVSPDHKNFLSASQDFTAKLWDLNGKVLQTFKGHQASVNTAIFSPDGKLILTAGVDHQAILWDSQAGKLLKKLEFNDEINGAIFNSQGDQLLLFGASKIAELWDVKGDLLKIFSHEESLTSAQFNADGSQILTTSEDGTLKIWKNSGELITTLAGHDGEIYDGLFYHNNQIISAGEDARIRRWELQNSHYLAEVSPFRGAVFNPSGQKMILFNELGATLFNADNGELLQKFTDQPIVAAAFSFDGQTVAVGGNDGKAQLFDLTGQLLESFQADFDSISRLSFSPNGQRLLVLSPDGVRLWKTLQPFDLTVFIAGKFTTAGLSPDGQMIFTANEQGQIAFWEGSEAFRTIDAHSQAINQVVFNPDGSKFLSISKDLTAKLWHTESGRFLTTLSGHNGELRHAVFAPTGDKILTTAADGTARLWDGFSGAPLGVLRGHKSVVLSGKFSADGLRAVTWGDGGDVKLWDIKTAQEIATLAKKALVVGINRQLTRLVTCHDTHATLWSMFPDTQSIINRAQQILPRPLSAERRVRFFLEDDF